MHADVDAMSAVLREDAKLADLLENPLVDGEKKKDVIKKIAGEAGFSDYTTNFMMLLVDKQRIEAASEVCAAFEDQYCRMTDTQVAVVKSADKLDQEQQFMIAKKVQVRFPRDPDVDIRSLSFVSGERRCRRVEHPSAGRRYRGCSWDLDTPPLRPPGRSVFPQPT